MFFVLRKQFVSAAIVLALCAHAGALPTMADYEQRLSIETSVVSVDASGTCGINWYAQSTSCVLADAAQIAHVLFQPTDISAYFTSPQNLAYSTTQQNNDVKNLPAVPGAVLMVIVGFLCVSLVRDRKAWISMLVVIVVLSQAGVKTLPKLTARLAQGRLSDRQAAKAAVANPIPVGNYFNWFSNLGNYHYIGIPVQDSFNPLVGNLAERIMSIVYFSPAFIFGNLARSPPIPD